MIFTRISPSERFQPIVKYFWWIELNCGDSADNFSERILPDPSSEIIFHLGDSVGRTSGNKDIQREPDRFFAGPNTKYYHLTARGAVRMIGAKLYPHAASFLLREDARRFRDSVIDLSAVWGDSIKTNHDNLAEAATLKARIALIENFLSERFRPDKLMQLKYLDFAVRHVSSSCGCVELPEISRKLGITPRYLEKLFIKHVGMRPKLFAQVVQLQHSVRLLNLHQTQTLTEIAHASGYFDQSHYNRVVKRFTGLSPSQLKQESMLTQQPFLDSIKD